MSDVALAALTFACLVAASIGSLVFHRKVPERHRQSDTHDVIKLTANIFVVMTSLLLGLLINNSKNTYELGRP